MKESTVHGGHGLRLAVALVFAAAVSLTGCSHTHGATSTSSASAAVVTALPQGGSTISTPAGAAYIPPQVEKMKGYKPPTPYMAAMFARNEADQARTQRYGQ